VREEEEVEKMARRVDRRERKKKTERVMRDV
jgi:hypothetical protein